MFKDVVGYEGLYLISEKGEVFSVRNKRILKAQISKNGYKRVELNVNGVSNKEFIHRLVAQAFIPNPNNYPIVNHKDENPSNNNVDNLEWCTYSYNTNYGNCIKKMVANREHIFGYRHVQSKTVYQFDLAGNFIKEYGSCGMASLLTGLDKKAISKCCSGKLKQYGGYGWSYTKEYHYDPHLHYTIRKGDIVCMDLNGNFVKKYHTQDELRADGLTPQNVCRVCRGERNSYKGFTFAYDKGEKE